MSLLQLSTSNFPLIVGVLHTATCLEKLAEEKRDLCKQGISLLEARLDSLPFALPQQWPLPVIATARHPAEGGHGNLSLQQRRALLEEALPWAFAIDIELRSAKALATTIAHAHKTKRSVILSFHDFRTVPSTVRLKELVSRAEDAGATCLKVAAMVSSEKELARLVDFQQLEKNLSIATMGMGQKSNESRLILAKLGSALTYGWLYQPQLMLASSAPWSTWELARRLRAHLEVKS